MKVRQTVEDKESVVETKMDQKKLPVKSQQTTQEKKRGQDCYLNISIH